MKTGGCNGEKIEIKMEKNKKNNKKKVSLKYQDTGLRILGQLRVSGVISSCWGG